MNILQVSEGMMLISEYVETFNQEIPSVMDALSSATSFNDQETSLYEALGASVPQALVNSLHEGGVTDVPVDFAGTTGPVERMSKMILDGYAVHTAENLPAPDVSRELSPEFEQLFKDWNKRQHWDESDAVCNPETGYLQIPPPGYPHGGILLLYGRCDEEEPATGFCEPDYENEDPNSETAPCDDSLVSSLDDYDNIF